MDLLETRDDAWLPSDIQFALFLAGLTPDRVLLDHEARLTPQERRFVRMKRQGPRGQHPAQH